MPALLRAARQVYANAIRAALVDAGFDDVPRNGVFVIGAIAREGAPLSAIIHSLGISKQAAGQLVDQLVTRGYLERDIDPEDRRRLNVHLSARGMAVAATSRRAVERIDDRLAQKLSSRRIHEARAVLAVLAALESDPDVPRQPRGQP